MRERQSIQLNIRFNFHNQLFRGTASLVQLVKVILIATTPKAKVRLLESWLDYIKRAGMKKLNESEFLRPYRSIEECTQPDYADVENDFPGGPVTNHSIIAQKYEDLKSKIMSRGFKHRD